MIKWPDLVDVVKKFRVSLKAGIYSKLKQLSASQEGISSTQLVITPPTHGIFSDDLLTNRPFL
jgi:hypothetical protein